MMSVLFYFSLFLLTTLIAYGITRISSKIWQGVLAFFLVFVPSFFAGIRTGIGTDYILYLKAFERMQEGLPADKNMEPGFVLLNKAVIAMGGNFQVLLFTIAVLSFGCVFYVFWKMREKADFTFCVFSWMFLYYQMSFNYIRQMLATAICVLAVWMFLKKSKSAGLVLTAAAAMIHVSALIILPFLAASLFMDQLSKPAVRVKILIGVVICALLYLFFANLVITSIMHVVPAKIGYYLKYLKVEIQPLGIGFLRYIILIIIPGFIARKKMSPMITWLWWVNIAGFCIWMTSYITHYELYRLSYTLLAFLPLLLGWFWSEAKECFGKWELAFKILTPAVLVFLCYYDFFLKAAMETVPYSCLWFSL